MKDYITGLIIIGFKKIFEYLMVLMAVFTAYILTYTNVWNEVSDKFSFTKDISNDISKNTTDFSKVLDGSINISKSD